MIRGGFLTRGTTCARCGGFSSPRSAVYGLQLLLVQWFASKHPIVELLREHPDPGFILASVGSAVFVAPLSKSSCFAACCKGGSRKCSRVGQPLSLIMGGNEESPLGAGKLVESLAWQLTRPESRTWLA